MAEEIVLIVVDPTSEQQPALDNMVGLLRRKQTDSDFGVEIKLLIALDLQGGNTDAANPKIYFEATKIRELEQPLHDLGIKVSTQITWSHQWTESILKAAENCNASYIMVSHPGETANRSMADDFWKLIRTTTLPMAIINPKSIARNPVVLMAMDLQDEDQAYRERAKRVLNAGKRVATLWGAEPHLVNAYSDSTQYPDRGRLVNLSGLPNECVHIDQGEPDEVISKVVHELNPMLLIIGATRRTTGIRAALRGVKIARVFDKIQHDIMIVT